MIEIKSEFVRTIAQIEVPANRPTPKIEVVPYSTAHDITGYILAACATAAVGLIGVSGNWLRKYFDTRLEMSIARQKNEFEASKEDRESSIAEAKEDRERNRKQADIFLTTTLNVIKEEKDSYLQALEGIKTVLLKIDNNQVEVTRQIIELKSTANHNTIRIDNLINTVGNLRSNTPQWDGNE